MKDRQANQDLWHLTIDDLLTPPAETPRLGGDGPFIINLSTSTAPIVIPPKDQLNIEGLHAYQISRTEEGRQRFRLRLGPISTELEADAILSAVRDRYPGAMIAMAADDDLRAISSATRVAKAVKAPRQAPRPTARSVERKAIPLPPQPTVASHDDPNEITGSGWDLDSLLPHLSGAAPTPKPRPAAAKAAPVAKKVAPPPPKAKPPAAKVPAAMPAVQKPAVQKTGAAPPILTTPAAPVAQAKPVPTPPVLTAALEPKPVVTRAAIPPASPSPAPVAQASTAAKTETAPPAPITEVRTPAPVAEIPAPPPPLVDVTPVLAASTPPTVEVAPPPAAEVAAPVVQAAPPVVTEAPPVAQPATPPIAAVTPPEPVSTQAPAKAAVFAPLPPLTLTKPRANTPVPTKSAPAAPPVQAAPPAIAKADPPPAIAPAEPPPADPLETDWAAILSAPVEDTASRPVFAVAVDSTPVPAAIPPAATAAPTPVAEVRVGDDSGLQRLVDKSNALIDELETRSEIAAPPSPQVPAPTPAPVFMPDAPAPAVVAAAPLPPPVAAEDPPAVIFSPLNTQSIEQKLAKLAEILHGDEHAESPIPAPAPHVAPAADATPLRDPEAAPAAPATAVEDIEIFFDDETPLASPTEAAIWPTVERRQEPRPELKSPAAVLTSIEDMIVVDEANNLLDLIAKEAAGDKQPLLDTTAATDQVPALKAPIVDVEVDLSVDVSIEVATAKAPPEPAAAEPSTRALALMLESDLTLEPELTLAPSEVAPPPVLIEDLIVSRDDREPSLEILVEKYNAKVQAAEPAPTPALPEAAAPPPAAVAPIEAPVEPKFIAPAKPEPVPQTAVAPVSVSAADDDIVVVSTVVLDNPAPKPPGDEPHVQTIVLEPKSAAANAAPADAAKPVENAKPAPVVIRTRESSADAESKNSTHVSARAAARAAKKMRLAKHAAKLAAMVAAKGNGATVAKPEHAPTAPAKSQTTASPAAAVPARTAAPTVAPTAAPTTPTKPDAPASKAIAAASRPAPGPSRKPPHKPQPSASKSSATSAKHVQPPAAKPAMPPAAHKPAQAPAPVASANGSNGAAAPERKVTIRTEHSATVDSTQTLRALTPLELADDQISKWFVIQLAVSEDDFDPDQIPHLDIFEAYRLYAVIGLDQGKILHALRLGFFSDEISASAVTSYVKAHFEAATVKRVSVAERERFAESQVAARKDIGATGVHTIIEMASPKPVPETRLADLAGNSGDRRSEEKSIWSRLVSPLKRQ